MSYFLAQSLLSIRCSAIENLLAAFLLAVRLISGSYSTNFNTNSGYKAIENCNKWSTI